MSYGFHEEAKAKTSENERNILWVIIEFLFESTNGNFVFLAQSILDGSSYLRRERNLRDTFCHSNI